DPHTAGAAPIVTSYVYGNVTVPGNAVLKGLLTSVVDGLGHETRYTAFDRYGNPTESVDAAGNRAATVYDARSRVLDTSDGFGRHSTMGYDTLDRVTSVARFAGTQPAGPQMASADIVSTMEYYEGGQPKLRRDGLGHE